MERTITEAHWGYINLPFKAGEIAEKGHLACIDTSTGFIVVGKVSATLIPLGNFMESKTGASPDGTTKIFIKLFKEIQAEWWVNDSADPIGQEDRGSLAYIKDSQTVSALATGRSAMGLILDTDPAKGVLVYSPLPFRPDLT